MLGPFLPFMPFQGRQGSVTQKVAGYIPGMTPNPQTDIGRRLGDSILSSLGEFNPFRNQALPRVTSSQAPRLEQFNPPGFDPNQPVTLADLRKTVQETGPVGSMVPAPSAAGASVTPAGPRLSPQDRAYQQERARVEAMVKSNPDMQKQEIAEARAKVRDMGMEEWAKANPELAAKVMPGQSGFSAIQGFVGGVGAPTTGPASAALQASPELNPASPTFAGGEGAPILRDLTPELIEQYQEQLLKQAK